MRVFEILDDIIETVETAKGVPMSSSAVVNRAAVLDLLDDLRDAFPGSLEDAREILEQRDEIVESARGEALRVQESSTSEATALVSSARQQADRDVSEATASASQTVQRANAEAERLVGGARAESESLLARSRDEAERTVAAGHAERDRLVTEHEVHRAATERAHTLVDEAERASAKLRIDADKYVESTLADLSLTLQRLMSTVDAGREKVHARGAAPRSDSRRSTRGEPVYGDPDFFDQNG